MVGKVQQLSEKIEADVAEPWLLAPSLPRLRNLDGGTY